MRPHPNGQSLFLEKINTVTTKINKIIKKNETFVSQYNDDFKDAVRFSVIDYGATVGTAKEMGTKFSETIRVASQGYKLEAYMHGPYLEVNLEHRIFFIETPSPRLSKAKLYGARVCYYESTINKTLALDIALDEYQAAYLLIILFQVMTWCIAKSKEIDLTKWIYTDFSQAVKSKTAV